jgi:hypothetical protein
MSISNSMNRPERFRECIDDCVSLAKERGQNQFSFEYERFGVSETIARHVAKDLRYSKGFNTRIDFGADQPRLIIKWENK